MAQLPFDPATLSAADRALYDRMAERRRSQGAPFGGPYAALMNHPQLCARVEDLGYYLKFEGRSTSMLSEQDDPTAIQSALNNLYSDGGQRFSVSNPEPFNAYIEFVGQLKGAAQDLITAEVGSVTPGDG